MKLKNIHFIFFILLFSVTFIFADYSFFTNWKYIESDQFKVVFIEGNEKAAQRVLNTFESVYPHLIKTIPVQKKKFTIILKNEGTQSNGFVTPYNARSEFFQTPSQGNYFGSNSFLDELVIHEGRHIIQVRKANHGFTYLASLLGGDQLQSIFSFWSIPGWVMEGDAVNLETALTNSGRGRLPSFAKGLKSILLEKQLYTLSEMELPSYSFYKPNHYVYGYFMMTYMKKNYGSQMPTKALTRSSWYSFLPYAYSSAMEALIDKDEDDIYYLTMKELKQLWQQQVDKVPITDAKILTSQSNEYTSYKYPQYSSDGCILAQKTSFSNLAKIVKICSNRKINREEKNLFKQFVNPYYYPISMNNNIITYTDYIPDIRFSSKSTTRIGYYNINTKKEVEFKNYTRLFAPTISYSKKYLATIKQSKNNQSSLVIFDLESKKQIYEIKAPINEFWQLPKWAKDEDVIYLTAIHSQSKGKALLKIDVFKSIITTILPFGNTNIFYPIKQGDYIYYSAEYSGIDNIYAYSISKKKIYQVTSRKYGAYFPDVSHDGKKLLFSDYTVNGYQIAEMNLDPKKWIPLEQVNNVSIEYYKPLIKQEAGGDVLAQVKNKIYNIHNYTGLSSLFNFHSWGLTGVVDQNNLPFSLISQNSLNNLTFILNYNYGYKMNTHYTNVKLSYSGFYPIFFFSGGYGYQSTSYTIDSSNEIEVNDSSSNHDTTQFLSYRQKDLRAGVSIPLNFSRLNYKQYIYLNTTYSLIQKDDYFFLDTKSFNSFLDENTQSVFYSFSYSSFLKLAYRDFYPQWGVKTKISFDHDISNNNEKEKTFLSNTIIYLPGLFKHNNFILSFVYRNNFHNIYTTDLLRGYYDIENNQYHFTTSIDYSFPLLYTHINIIYLLYINRILVNIFYDYAHIQNDLSHPILESKEFSSIGIKFRIETYLFNKSYIKFYPYIRITYLMSQEYIQKLNNNKNYSIDYWFLFSYNFDID